MEVVTDPRSTAATTVASSSTFASRTLIGQVGRHRFRTSSPTRAEAPRHRAFFVALLQLAAGPLPDHPLLEELGYLH
jgi:hypothetical protein